MRECQRTSNDDRQPVAVDWPIRPGIPSNGSTPGQPLPESGGTHPPSRHTQSGTGGNVVQLESDSGGVGTMPGGSQSPFRQTQSGPGFTVGQPGSGGSHGNDVDSTNVTGPSCRESRIASIGYVSTTGDRDGPEAWNTDSTTTVTIRNRRTRTRSEVVEDRSSTHRRHNHHLAVEVNWRERRRATPGLEGTQPPSTQTSRRPASLVHPRPVQAATSCVLNQSDAGCGFEMPGPNHGPRPPTQVGCGRRYAEVLEAGRVLSPRGV
jgi:hypothetical protein